jgi:hypothetical protein
MTSKQGEEYRLVNIDTVRENRHFVLISPIRCVFSNPMVRPDSGRACRVREELFWDLFNPLARVVAWRSRDTNIDESGKQASKP